MRHVVSPLQSGGMKCTFPPKQSPVVQCLIHTEGVGCQVWGGGCLIPGPHYWAQNSFLSLHQQCSKTKTKEACGALQIISPNQTVTISVQVSVLAGLSLLWLLVYDATDPNSLSQKRSARNVFGRKQYKVPIKQCQYFKLKYLLDAIKYDNKIKVNLKQ